MREARVEVQHGGSGNLGFLRGVGCRGGGRSHSELSRFVIVILDDLCLGVVLGFHAVVAVDQARAFGFP